METFEIPTLFARAYPGIPLPTLKDPEYWMPIPGFPGYDCSSHGRFRTYKRRRGRIGGGSEWVIDESPQGFLCPIKNRDRFSIGLWANGKYTSHQIGAWLLRAFVCDKPDGYWNTCHKDSNPLNNCLSNLRWDTSTGNRLDAVNQGTHNTVKLSPENVIDIRRDLMNGRTRSQIANEWNVGYTAIYKIDKRETWSHVA